VYVSFLSRFLLSNRFVGRRNWLHKKPVVPGTGLFQIYHVAHIYERRRVEQLAKARFRTWYAPQALSAARVQVQFFDTIFSSKQHHLVGHTILNEFLRSEQSLINRSISWSELKGALLISSLLRLNLHNSNPNPKTSKRKHK